METASSKEERHIAATAVSRGIGVGRAVFVRDQSPQLTNSKLNNAEIQAEIERLRSAVAVSIKELKQLTDEKKGSTSAEVFSVHQLILESSVVPSVEETIESERCDAETAVRRVTQQFAERQRSVDDRHIADKYIDLKDIADRLIKNLGRESATVGTSTGAIYVVAELTPSLLTELSKTFPKGIVSEQGGWTSHASIIARELKLPMVTGIRFGDERIREGDVLVVDGVRGELIVAPTNETLETLETYDLGYISHGGMGRGDSNFLVTSDGVKIVIRANADSVEAFDKGRLAGAKGIGLYRSEAIFNKFGGFPDEATQIEAYREIAVAAGEDGVRIRTFDVSVDQLPHAMRVTERNPSLGLRSIRLSLTHEDYFRTQVRAVLQASHGQNIDIILPMIGGVNDVVRLKKIINEERQQLKADAIATGEPLIGAMIEIPSAVLTASEIARHIDLLCLGTNDLVQYLLAVDRDNEAVAGWYETLHPAVLRAISQVIKVSNDIGVPLTVCGEIARSPFYVPLLLGLGARELSMNVNAIAQIRRLVSFLDLRKCTELVGLIERSDTAEEIEEQLREFYETHWRSLFPAELLAHKHQ